MKKARRVSITRKATLWGIYIKSKDGLEFLRKQVSLYGEPKPLCAPDEIRLELAKGRVTYTMGLEQFLTMARVSEFVEEAKNNEN